MISQGKGDKGKTIWINRTRESDRCEFSRNTTKATKLTAAATARYETMRRLDIPKNSDRKGKRDISFSERFLKSSQKIPIKCSLTATLATDKRSTTKTVVKNMGTAVSQRSIQWVSIQSFRN